MIFVVDSLILAKQLARHLPWACRSENLIALHNNVYMFVIPFPLFTSRGTFVIFIVSSTRPQIQYLIRRSMSVIRMVFRHFGSVQPAHHVYLSWQLGGIRDCRVDCILGRPKFSFFISMRSIAPTSNQSVGISLITQSPLQASPMNVGNALADPLFTDFQNASECICSHEPWVFLPFFCVFVVPTPSLGDLPGTPGTSQRMGWSHIASYTTTLAQKCAST